MKLTFSQRIRKAFAVLLDGTEDQSQLPEDVFIRTKEDADNAIFQYHGKLPNVVIATNDATGLFEGNEVLLSIDSLDAKRVKFADKMFSNCKNLYAISNKSINKIDFSKCKSMNYMFEGCKSLTVLQELDTSSCISMAGMFSKSSIIKVPKMDTSKVVNMEAMFSSCNRLETIPKFNTVNVKNFNYAFARCGKLQFIPEINTSNATTMIQMFTHCVSLESIPMMNTSNVTNMNKMFRECNRLKALPRLNTSKVTDMNLMCYKCYALRFVYKMDLSCNPSMDKMFDGCMNREELICMRDGKLYLGNKLDDKKKRYHPLSRIGASRYDKVNKERLSGDYYK